MTTTDVIAPEVRPDRDVPTPADRPSDERVNWRSSIPFIGLHLLPLLAIWTGVTATALVLFAGTLALRGFLITAG